MTIYDDMIGIMQQARAFGPPRELAVIQTVFDRLKAKAMVADDRASGINAFFGIPLVVDDTLPSPGFEMRRAGPKCTCDSGRHGVARDSGKEPHYAGCPRWGTPRLDAVPPRPAAGDSNFPYMLADTPEEFQRLIHLPHPSPFETAPDATAGGRLREVRRVARDHVVEVWLSDGKPAFTTGSWTCSCGARGANGSRGQADHVGQCVEAALRDVLAAAARDTEKVRRVETLREKWRELVAHYDIPATAPLYRSLDELNNALDGTP